MTYPTVLHPARDRAGIRREWHTRSAVPDTTLRCEIVRSLDRFADIAPQWDALASLHETPLALHGWYAAALDAQREDGADVAIPLIWRGERMVAAAPLMHSTGHGAVRLVPIDAFTGEPDRVLYEDEEALLALADACADLGEPLLFRRFAAPVDDAYGFARQLRRHAPGMLREHHRTSFLQMPESFAQFEESMSKSRRKTIRRKQNMMMSAGGYDLRVFSPTVDEVAPILERFAVIENAGWKGRAGTSLKGDPVMGRFVLQVAQSFARNGNAVASFLTIGGKDAAGRIILQHGSNWCGIKIGFDEEFAKYSPGIVQMHETLRAAHACGIRSYRFLGVSEDWQNYWPHERRGDYRLAAYPLSFAGCRALIDDTRRGVKALIRRL